MKQKLPEKEFLYKNLCLDEIRKTEILSNSCSKCSLIRSLTIRFFEKENFANSFDFRTIILLINSYYSRKNTNFILNSLMLFALPFFISIYCSNVKNIVEKKNFSLIKVQRQDHRGKDHMDIYKKSFRDLNKNFVDIFLRRIFQGGGLSKHKSISEIITHCKNQIVYEEMDYSIEKERDEYKEMGLPDSHIIKKKVEINPQIFHFVNLNQLSNSQIDYSNFQWTTKNFYLNNNDKSVSRAVFMRRMFLNKYHKSLYLLKKEVDSYVDFVIDKYIRNNSVSRKSQEKDRKFFFFPKSLLMAEVTQNILPKKDFTKFSKKFRKIDQLRTYTQSDDIRIISWKIRKSHLNFAGNYSSPSNDAYNIICEKYCLNKQIRYEIKRKSHQLFADISDLLPFFIRSRFKKILSLVGFTKFQESLGIKSNELTILIDRKNQVRNLDFTEKISLISQDNNGTSNMNNELRELYSLIKNLIVDNYRNSSEFWNNLFLKLFNLESAILHKYLRIWEKNSSNRFIYSINKDIEYNELGFKIYHWLYEIDKNLSRIAATSGIPFTEILEKYFQNSHLDNINKIFDPLQISTNVCNINVDRKKLFNWNLIRELQFIENQIHNWIAYLFINRIDGQTIIDSSTEFSTENNILLNLIRNKKLFVHSNYKLDVENSSINFRSNYREIFSFRSEEHDNKDYDITDNDNNNNVIYLEFLKNFLKYNRLNRISLKQRFLFLEKELFKVVQLKFHNFLFFGIFQNKCDGTKFLFFHDFHKKISGRNTSYFSELENKKIETLFSRNKIKIKTIRENLLQDLNNTEIINYYNILQSESLTKSLQINGLIFQAINKILISPRSKSSKSEDLKYKSENKILIHLDEVYEKSTQIENFDSFKKESSFGYYNYISWFFTHEWWEYHIHIFIATLRERFTEIGSYSEYFTNNIEFIGKNLINLCGEERDLCISNSKWNSRLFFYHTEKMILNFVGSDPQLINNFNNVYWGIFSLMLFFVLFHKNYFSILIGSDSIDLWKDFENIKYLTDTSRAFYFNELLNRNKIQLNKAENLSIFFSNLKHYAKNIRFYLLTKKDLNKWLISYKSVDQSRRKRNLLVQSLVTPIQTKEYGFQLYYQPEVSNNPLFEYRINSQQGLSYLRYLSEMLKKKLINYPVHLADKWIFSASLQKIISSRILGQTKKFDPRFQKIPVPLQLGLSCSRGILLIGPVETGRSYLIKNLAADSSVPLLGISINKLLYNKPDIITESWMNILIQSLRRLNLTLDLAKGMSPCIIWIRDIHQLDVDRPTQNIESDPTFLLGILSKYFQTDSLKSQAKNNIIIVGSTHVPKRVDPSLISPDRLDRVLNIRLLNIYQRKNQFPILLNRNNLKLNKNLLYFTEFGSRTMGYNIRDLAALTNETSLISITKNKLFVYHDISKLAFHRQVFGFSHTNNKPNYQQNFKMLLYKIGRAIIQNIMIEGSATNPLNISNYLWRRKFYYLSKWYSESSPNDPIIKESTVLVHVLGSLAGIAAHDSWFVSEEDSNISISLDKSVENDLDLASSLLETFSNDFIWLETCENQFLDYQKKKSKMLLTKNLLNTMHNGIFSIANGSTINNQNEFKYKSLLSGNEIINKEIDEFNNTTWSPRFWRLSFSRNHLFNWIKRPNDFELFHMLVSTNENDFGKKNQNYQSTTEKKEQLLYERILPRVRKRNVEELESQFENILLEENSEILGFFGSSTQYQMEFQTENKPRLFIGKRILWDPIGSFSQIRNFVFSRREFFVDEEMLRRLYITYGVRRERERSLSGHRIKRFFICRGYNKNLINKLSVRWWNKLPMDQKQNIYTLGQIEKIGIRLERPQIFTPVYLYQRWLIENIPGKFSRLNLLAHRARWAEINKLFLNDSLTYKILLESYQYLLDFFTSNKKLLNQMTKTLLNKKWIFQNEIRYIIRHIKKSEF